MPSFGGQALLQRTGPPSADKCNGPTAKNTESSVHPGFAQRSLFKNGMTICNSGTKKLYINTDEEVNIRKHQRMKEGADHLDGGTRRQKEQEEFRISMMATLNKYKKKFLLNEFVIIEWFKCQISLKNCFIRRYLFEQGWSVDGDKFTGNSYRMNIFDHSSGVYILKIRNNENVFVEKLVKP